MWCSASSVACSVKRGRAEARHGQARKRTSPALPSVSTTEVLSAENFLPVAQARKGLEKRFGALVPVPDFRTNGPATYYRLAGQGQKIGFIGAITNLHFCESCNKLRLTCDGKLRPCLGSFLEFDIMKPLRAGATDDELRRFFIDVVDRKPEQHDFRNNYQHPSSLMIESRKDGCRATHV